MNSRALLSLASLCGLAAVASAQDFNVDALNIYGNPTNAYGAAAGQTGFWQNVDAFPIGPQALADTSGGATAATVDYSAGFNFAFDNALTAGDDQALLDDLQCNAGGTTWTFAGLAAGNYTLYCYAWAPDSPTTFITGVNVAGGSAGTQNCGGAAWTGAHVSGSTYVSDTVSGVAAGGSIVVTFSTVSGFGSINGVQLVHTPSGPPPPSNYCTAGTTTNGCLGSMAATANPSITFANACIVTANNIEGQKQGVLFYGVTGPNAAPWGLGSPSFLCVKAPTQRTGTQGSGGTTGACDGTLTLDWNAYQTANPTSVGNPFSVGQNIWAQGWFRDPPAPKTTNLTNGLMMTCVP